MDAILALYARSRCPVGHALVSAAGAHLGNVIRDAAWIARLLTERSASGQTREALIVALGLLGECMPLETVARWPSSESTARAWVLGASLASLDVDLALAYVRGLERASQGAVREIAASAVERLTAGRVLGVIERD